MVINEDFNNNIIDLVEKHFGISDTPFKGITYIMPDGKFLDLRKYTHHSDVEKWLIDNNYTNGEYNPYCGSPTLRDCGCFRCCTSKYYIQLPPYGFNEELQEALSIWLAFLSNINIRKEVEVSSSDGQHIMYKVENFDDIDYIVNRIRHYYIYGKLYENYLEKN